MDVTALARQVRESLIFKRQGYRWMVKGGHLSGGIQTIHTPFTLCNEIVGKLKEYCDLAEKDILVLFNVEFLDVLINDFGVDPKRITFAADCKLELEMAARWYGVGETIQIEYKDKDSMATIKSKFKRQFDVVVGNPPYQAPNAKSERAAGGKNTLWDKFVSMSLSACKDKGFVCMVHPSGWRCLPSLSDVANLLKSRNMRYLEIHDTKDGMRVFGASTRYDWYVLENSQTSGPTTICGQNGEKFQHTLGSLPVVPNEYHELLAKVFESDPNKKIEVIQDSQYHTARDFMSPQKDKKHSHPCINHVNSDGQVSSIHYSSKQLGHFGQSKIVLGRMAGGGVYADKAGEFGITEAARAIVVAKPEIDRIVAVLKSERFLGFMRAVSAGSKDRYEINVIRHFRKDFWREFI